MAAYWKRFTLPEGHPVFKFLSDSSLHGLKYLGFRNIHVSERMLWLTAFTVSLSTSIVIINIMWTAYADNPIVTIFDPKELPLSRIPFPAVTICNTNTVKKSAFLRNFGTVERQKRRGGSNETILRGYAEILDTKHLCNSGKSFIQKQYNQMTNLNKFSTNMFRRRKEFAHLWDVKRTLENSAQTCEEMIVFCLWLDGMKNCSELFSKIETAYGYCCVFNNIPINLLHTFPDTNRPPSYDEKYWRDADLNYGNLILDENDVSNRERPYRQLFAGRSAGLSVFLDPDLEEYHCTNTDSEGFIVGINTPLDFPRMQDTGVAVQTGTETFLSVWPDITISAESAKKATLEKRRCYFEGERKLAYFTKYTVHNCMEECIANQTISNCGCSLYFMPKTENSSILICTPSKFRCVNSVKAKMFQSPNIKCAKCWPACTEIQFQTEVTSLRIRQNQLKVLLEHFPNITTYKDNDARLNNVSIVHIYYEADSIFPRVRKENTSLTGFISSAGCILGLCMGFSMLSLLEIIYHGILRVICRVYRKQSNEKKSTQGKGSPNQNWQANAVRQWNLLNPSSHSFKPSYPAHGKAYSFEFWKAYVSSHDDLHRGYDLKPYY